METLAFYNMKGGVGKTTTAVNLAYQASKEHRILLWDLDPQGAATFYLGGESGLDVKLKKVLKGKVDHRAFIRQTAYQNLSLLPTDFDHRHLDQIFSNEKKGSKKFSRFLDTLASEYDILFFDCPPSISHLSEIIFRNVSFLVMPVIPTPLSLKAYEQVRSYLSQVDSPSIILPFFSMFDWRKKIHRTIFDQGLAEQTFLSTPVPTLSVIEQMGIHQAPLAEYAPKSTMNRAYMRLWQEIAERIGTFSR